MGYVRAREPLAVRDPEVEGLLQNLDPAKPYADNHPLVKAYPWAFVSDEELAAEHGPVEAATRAPGEKRATRR